MTPDPADQEVERIELHLLLEAVYQRYGYDFREYSLPSVKRRMAQFLADKGVQELGEVTRRLLRDLDFFHTLIPYFSVSVTALFRDPFFYAAMAEKVVPWLRTWPHFKIWHAGCATGEEVFSDAILLREAGLLNRATLYATDISQSALDTGRAGIYSLEIIRQGSANYLAAGGLHSLSDHYQAQYHAAIMHPELRRRMTFSRHNLAMDNSFGEMQVIICRNVLIYFNEALQNKVLELFWESLDHGGILCLGDKESLAYSAVADRFEALDESARIFRKKTPR